jgi:hypothetical protein
MMPERNGREFPHVLAREIRNTLNPAAITAVILTRDEERNLPRALTSLPRGVRVLVLDAGSRDHTVQFARSAGADVVEREWTDFVDARRFALSCVKTPWALMLDADEALDDVLRESILGAAQDVDCYRIKRTTYFCGKPMRLWRDEPLVRCFASKARACAPIRQPEATPLSTSAGAAAAASAT